MSNPINLIENALGAISNNRTREVVRRRFGLHDGRRHTLEVIGQDHGITRERVRQIESNGLSALRDAKVLNRFEPVFEAVRNHLSEHGDLKREDKLYDDLTYVCFPAKEIERLKKSQDVAALDRCRSAFYLILTLGDDFAKVPENEYFYPVWTSNKNSVKTAKKAVESLIKHLNVKKSVLPAEKLVEAAKNILPDLSDKAIYSYVDAAKHIKQDHKGHYGLIHWFEISPRGVKDKAYIVLKNENRPLHFSEVTDLINRILPSGRRAYVQTVHNELIKDKRFVLVGRGLYALSEWGYQPGTVSEIISQVLKQEGPLTKEEIAKKVLAKRLVKENTILINLQNRKLFERDNTGRYLVRA